MNWFHLVAQEDRRDVNIHIHTLHDIPNQIKRAVGSQTNVSVLLYSERYKGSSITETLQSDWSPEFYHYLKDRSITLDKVVTIIPKVEAEISEPKRVAPKASA